MIKATYIFPDGFIWGTASSSHQVEGGNTNNQWHAWEQAGRTRGKSGRACDWWGGRWREDFDRLARAGQKAHRLSIEWSRIEPAPNRWDEDALQQYRRMLRGLRQRGITPMVTLHHFSNPLWFEKRGAWLADDSPQLFERFVGRAVAALRHECNWWCTINEPNVYAGLGYITGNMPPGGGGLKLAIRVQANMARAHAAAYRLIHQLQPRAQVGYALHFRPSHPRRPWMPLDALMARLRHLTVNLAFPSAISTGVMRTPFGSIRMRELKGTQDFVGLNYYSVETVWFDAGNRKELYSRGGYPEGADLSESGLLANIPEGLFESIRWAVRAYPSLPIYITENGIDSSDDAIRRRYLAQHAHQVWRAVNFNWKVKGYFHWTLVDNFEWERGWTQRFGLWALDINTQQRTRRRSADLYAAICTQNALTSTMVNTYCPEVSGKMFPG